MYVCMLIQMGALLRIPDALARGTNESGKEPSAPERVKPETHKLLKP